MTKEGTDILLLIDASAVEPSLTGHPHIEEKGNLSEGLLVLYIFATCKLTGNLFILLFHFLHFIKMRGILNQTKTVILIQSKVVQVHNKKEA